MPGHGRSGTVVLAAVLLGVAGCGPGNGPQRVPSDGAPCSADMPASARSGEQAMRFGAVIGTEQSWRVLIADAADPAAEPTTYILRRGRVPAASGLKDAALLDAAAARMGRGVALEDGVKPTVSKVPTATGEAVELRWVTGATRNATRLLLIPGGYCEVTIQGARTEAAIASYLASVQVGR
jgi:hypothetical protein